MTNKIKRANMYTRQAASIQKSSRLRPSGDVQATSRKDEVHFNPDERSGNEQRLLEAFYEKTHNLMASFIRLEDDDDRHQFYKTHKKEAISGGEELVCAINELIDDAKAYDRLYGSFYHFLTLAILHDHEKDLSRIGIEITKDEHLDIFPWDFYDALLNGPHDFEFLFRPNDGLIDRLDHIYFKISLAEDPIEASGQILDIKG